MSISVYSVFTAFLWFNLFIIILCKLRKKLKSLFANRFSPLLLVAILCLMRLFLPFELPFALEIESTHLLPWMLHLLRINLITIGPINITLEIVILLYVSIVAVVRLYRALSPAYKKRAQIKAYELVNDSRSFSIFERVKRESPSLFKCELRVVSNCLNPFTFGFLFSTIILPERYLLLPDDDIYHVLSHEWQHHRNKDNLIKALIEVLCCIMWWNPLVPLLRPVMNALLEFKCDANATKKANITMKFKYFTSIKHAVALNVNEASTTPNDQSVAASFLDEDNDTDIIERCNVLFSSNDKNQKQVVTFIACSIILFLISFCFVIQPFGLPPTEALTSGATTIDTGVIMPVTPETSLLIDNHDGTYSLSVNGEYWYDITKNEIKHEPYHSLPIVNDEKERNS